MSETEQIVVTVRPDGTVVAATRGVVGERCLDYVAVLEQLLDAETTTSEYTEDRWRSTVTTDVVAEQTVGEQPGQQEL